MSVFSEQVADSVLPSILEIHGVDVDIVTAQGVGSVTRKAVVHDGRGDDATLERHFFVQDDSTNGITSVVRHGTVTHDGITFTIMDWEHDHNAGLFELVGFARRTAQSPRR